MPNSELIKKIICLESEELSYSMVRKNIYSPQERQTVSDIIGFIKKKYHKDKFLMFDNLRTIFKQINNQMYGDYYKLLKYIQKYIKNTFNSIESPKSR